MNNIDISVVVLTYYHEQYIARALDSILSQKTTYSYEIIVSDDCSGDNTVSILQELSGKISGQNQAHTEHRKPRHLSEPL